MARFLPRADPAATRAPDGDGSQSDQPPVRWFESRTVVKRIFSIILVLVVFQSLFIWSFGEPYPALTMPRFSETSIIRDLTLSRRQVVIWAHFRNGDSTTVDYRDLLREAPVSQRSTIAARMFTTLPDPSASAPTIRDRVGSLLGLWTGQERDDPRMLQQTRQWLVRGLRSLYPGRDPSSVEFLWYVRTVTLDRGLVRSASTFTVSRIVDRYVVDVRDVE